MKKTINVIVSTIVTIALVISVIGVCFAVKSFITPHKQASSVDDEESKATVSPTEESILAAVNAERAKVGVAPLKLHPNISKAAQIKSNDMIIRNYRQHKLPDDSSAIATPEMHSYIQPVCSLAGENFASDEGGITTETAMQLWLNSPTHKSAILDSKYTYTGIGVSGGKVVVQWFCVAR